MASVSASASCDFKQPSLQDADPEMWDLIEHEQTRQWKGLELIASENFTSRAVMESLSTCLTNKYSEGLPGNRYYGGNEFIDQIENLCIKRALVAFHLDPKVWGVNVQPYSGSTANFAAYNAVLTPHDRLMGLDLPSGGHLTHGFYNAKGKKISATSIYFESLPYRVNPTTGFVDYDALESTALVFRPKLIVCGASAYPRDWDYRRLREIADKVEALLMCDMAHFSGLVASQVVNDPFAHCHLVTTTTHKSLRGPRAGMIFFRKDGTWNLEQRVNASVFPSVQGGPHNNTIAAMAVQLKEVATPDFVNYSKQVKANASALAQVLIAKKYKLVTNGTDTHLILVDLRPLGLTGNKVENVCDAVSITLNKNSVYGDVSALSPGGVRLGSPALTSRGFKEQDFVQVAEFVDRAIKIAIDINVIFEQEKQKAKDAEKSGEKGKGPVFKDFLSLNSQIPKLREEVEQFSKKFPMPGFDVTKLKYTS